MSKVQLSDARSHKAAFTLRTSSERLMTDWKVTIGYWSTVSVDQ